MPAVVREGDSGTYGGTVKVIQQSLSYSDGEPKVATVSDLYFCSKHGPAPARLLNGCYFNRIQGRQVAIVNVTKASCGCRMKTGSPVYRCCSHLDAKAQRLAEREELIANAREAANDPQRGAGMTPGMRDALRDSANTLDRLNRDVRYADASVATYLDPNSPAQFSIGKGNAPEGMIRLSADEYRGSLPADLQDPLLWNNDKTGYHADLYYDELNGTYITAFRGTDDLKKDVLASVEQAHGMESAQYDTAMRLGKLLDKDSKFFGTNANETLNMEITGHSLGGGLGSAAGSVGGIPYTTFNSSGLHPATVPRFTGGARSNAVGAPLGTRYHTSGDPLTWAQTQTGSDTIYTTLVGTGFLGALLAGASASQTGGRVPSALGNTDYPIGNDAWGTGADAGHLGGGHSSLTVVQTIEDQKKQAEAAIKSIYKLEAFNLIKGSLTEQQQQAYWLSVDKP